MVTKKKTTAKKTTRKVAGRKATQKKLPGWILLLIGMFFGLVIAVFGYIYGWVPKPENPNKKPIAQEVETKQSNTIEDKSEDLAIEPKDNFNFYTTLQDMEVQIDSEDLAQTNTREPATYYIQLGAFKQLQDAETLKARVAFTGQSANIVSGLVKNINWYRVRMGPYKGTRKVDVAKRTLQKNNFQAIVVKAKE